VAPATASDESPQILGDKPRTSARAGVSALAHRLLPTSACRAEHDPSPAVVKNGRPFLYDGKLSSGHGDLACASYHAGGNLDNIAWDLGDPNGALQPPPPNQVDYLAGNVER